MTDIMAREALRTTLTEAFQAEFDRVYGDGRQMHAGDIAKEVLVHLPEVEWEFATNENGVPVRRLAVKGKWLVDPSIVETAAQTRPSSSDWENGDDDPEDGPTSNPVPTGFITIATHPAL
jgi:hypothetical protein